ncbi:MAG: LuxR family transcriptional regulator, maltose regulon positive regulatory protein [Nocardioidaceae bacterium]|nr:LuxR family transcriptional regulator, maltose regulon positive regulatory protein [Nocardioidaceae bacterium]
MAVVHPAAARDFSPESATASDLMARSRLHVPAEMTHHLCRERLSGLLSSSTAPLALLSAPAGSGKTALAAEWAHRLDGERDVVWVTCHGYDVDPWADVLRGMRGGVRPDPEPGGVTPRRGDGRCHIEEVIETAGASPLPWTVFLDGYELGSLKAGDELDRLLTYAGADLQVVLTTRADPVLPLHRYRLAGDLLEVRAADLAFTDAEAGELLRTGGVELDPADLHALNSRLAGWAAGLRFAIPGLAAHPAPQALVSSALTYNGNINSYLVEEVLDAQAPELRELILATSVPDVLDPQLLEELTGEPAALTRLRLMRANVFLEVTPADDGCLRYVPFFRDLVRAQLAYEAPDRLRELHHLVVDWYVKHGRWEDAVAHLHRAGERLDVASLLVDHLLVGRLLCERRGDPLRRLVASSPARSVSGPNAHLLAAASALADADSDGSSAHLDAARAEGVRPGRAAVTMAVLEAVLADAGADPGRAEQLAARAEQALAAHSRAVERGADDTAAVLLLVRARSALRLGAVQRADRLFEEALDCPTASWSATHRSLCLAHAAVLHSRADAVSRATDEAEEAVAAARVVRAAPALAATAHLARACTALAADDLAGARVHLAETTVIPDALWQVAREVVAARLGSSSGAVQAATARLDAAARAAERAGPWSADWLREERARLRSGDGRFHDALRAGQVAAFPEQRRPEPSTTGADGRVVEPLTPRELDVLVAMSEWLTTEEIADKLFVSVNTVRTHVRNILTKLGVSRRNAAIREAIRLGLLTAEAEAEAGVVRASNLVRPA